MRLREHILIPAAALVLLSMACNTVDRLLTPDEPSSSDSLGVSGEATEPAEAEPNPTATPAPLLMTSEECLIGTWDVDTDSYQAFIGWAFEAVDDEIDGLKIVDGILRMG